MPISDLVSSSLAWVYPVNIWLVDNLVPVLMQGFYGVVSKIVCPF